MESPPRIPFSIIKSMSGSILNLYDKSKYIIHHETLKLYESLGFKITKIHRGIKFDECLVETKLENECLCVNR